MLLENVVEVYDEAKLTKELDAFADTLSLLEDVAIAPVSDTSSFDELMNLMGEAINRFTAARKGMGFANKLKKPEERKKHRGAIMRNMNKLRSLMARIDKKIKAFGGKEKISEAKGKGDPEQSFKQLDRLAQIVWAAKGVEAKKSALDKLIDALKFKDKADKFRRDADKATSEQRLDMLAANLMQVGHGDKVIK